MKLVLVDRDGVLNEELPDCVRTPEELKLFPTALKALALFKASGFACVVVTNQSIVGRGIITDATLACIHERLKEKVRVAGGEIADIFFCTDAPDKATYRRKPKPGMLIEALEKYEAEAHVTPYIGDALTDMQAAHAAGCPRYLVMTGKGRKTADSLTQEVLPVTRCGDLLDAAHKILQAYA